jgi:hypothetical protein
MFSGVGKILILLGGLLLILGVILIISEKIPFIGKLPGDFTFKGKNFTLYFPLATGIVLSLLLTLILNLIGRK